jgi:hypothetical protein
MVGGDKPRKRLLDERSVVLYNTGDAKLVLSVEGELRIETDDHSPLLCKFQQRGICVWDRASKRERVIPWAVVAEIGAVVDRICLN